MRKISSILLFVVLLSNVSDSFAETKYIKDNLRWSLREQPLKSSQSLRLVSSGMKVEVLIEIDGYTKIRLGTGEEGWVSSSHLVKQKTNNILLQEARIELARVKENLEELKRRSPIAELEEKLAQSDEKSDALSLSLDAEKEKVRSLREQLSPLTAGFSSTKNSLLIKGTVCIILFLMGFFIGKSLIEKKVKAKFNGMKVW